jgi:hypothetical protein
VCSKEKSSERKPIQAIQRYQSEHIQMVYAKAKKAHAGFRILSGKYGLLKPRDKIEWYDQRLTATRARDPKLIQKIKRQLQNQKIKTVTFFTKNPSKNPNWKPYSQLLQKGCKEAKIPLFIHYFS